MSFEHDSMRAAEGRAVQRVLSGLANVRILSDTRRMHSTDEQTTEKAIDRAVMRRLRTDRAYLNAENAEDQAERERQIEREEVRRHGGVA